MHNINNFTLSINVICHLKNMTGLRIPMAASSTRNTITVRMKLIQILRMRSTMLTNVDL